MAPTGWLLFSLIFLASLLGCKVQAQFRQNEEFHLGPNGEAYVFWRATDTSTTVERIIDIAPELVVLQYNCY